MIKAYLLPLPCSRQWEIQLVCPIASPFGERCIYAFLTTNGCENVGRCKNGGREVREIREVREFREIREFSDFLNSLNSLTPPLPFSPERRRYIACFVAICNSCHRVHPPLLHCYTVTKFRSRDRSLTRAKTLTRSSSMIYHYGRKNSKIFSLKYLTKGVSMYYICTKFSGYIQTPTLRSIFNYEYLCE